MCFGSHPTYKIRCPKTLPLLARNVSAIILSRIGICLLFCTCIIKLVFLNMITAGCFDDWALGILRITTRVMLYRYETIFFPIKSFYPNRAPTVLWARSQNCCSKKLFTHSSLSNFSNVFILKIHPFPPNKTFTFESIWAYTIFAQSRNPSGCQFPLRKINYPCYTYARNNKPYHQILFQSIINPNI